jgi:preprotein translocase subunit SecY
MSTGATYKSLFKAWDIPDLKRRLWFVLWALLVFVVCAHIPAIGIDPQRVRDFFTTGAGSGGMFDLLGLFSGGALRKLSILALGIMPYINASIMMQLLAAVDPKMKELNQEGEEGRKTIGRWTRYLAVILAFLQGGGLIISIYGGFNALLEWNNILTLFSVVAGSCFLMWLGDEISQKGVGNGTSMIIMIGIVAAVPSAVLRELSLTQVSNDRILALLILLIFLVGVVAGIVYIQLSARKIPVQYARRQIGRRVYGGQNTYLPIKLTMAGVIPIIFAISLLMVPTTIIGFFPSLTALNQQWSRFSQSLWYILIEFLLVFVFTFIYTAFMFNTQDVADNLKKNNGFIPGIRPGKPTYDFLDRVLHRVTFFGALFLSGLAIMPNVINHLVTAITHVQITSFFIGGTSLLIVVGVALDTVQQIQAHMVMQHYSGFNK